MVVAFERPTFEGADFTVELSADRARPLPGAASTAPLPGVWNLHATMRRGDDLFVHEQRIVLR